MKDAEFQLVLDRVIEAPRAAIWRCWTEPQLLEQWFCPKPWYVTGSVLDFRPGGEFSCVMHGPAGEEVQTMGVFLEVEEGRKLISTDAFSPGWRPSGKPFMASEVTMEDEGEGRTRYIARAMHWNAETMKEHEAMGFHQGWGAAADQLEALAKSL